MKKIIILSTLFVLSYSLGFAQFLGNHSVQILLKGTVFDEYTNNPVGLIIEFKTNKGKWFKIKSDSITGKYQQVFQSGEEIEATLYDWDVVRTSFRFTLPDTSKYIEFEKDFKVKHLTYGLNAFEWDCFPTGESGITSKGVELIKSLDEVLKFNRNVKFTIYVTAFDSFYKTQTKEEVKTVVKEKKKKKTIVEYKTVINEPPADRIKQLVDARLPQIEKIVNSLVRAKGKIFVEPNYSSGELPEIKGTNQPDVVIVVRELKNILEK